MSLYRISFRKATGPDLPQDFDPDKNPILAVHYFGLELREVCEVVWSLARQVHPPPAESMSALQAPHPGAQLQRATLRTSHLRKRIEGCLAGLTTASWDEVVRDLVEAEEGDDE